MKILIAADGSEHTQRMLDYMAKHAWLTQGNGFSVLTVVLEVPRRAASFVDASMVTNYYEDEAKQVLDPIRAFFAEKNVPVDCQYKAGYPPEVIAAEAEKGYDLLALGSHGHGTLGSLIMGSVATKVMSLTKVPVLILR